MAGDQGTTYGTPNGTGTPQWEPNPAEINVTELPDGVLLVRDPLLAEPYRIGDQSLITNAVTDQIMAQAYWYYPQSVRQLHKTERYEVHPGAGRLNRGGHMLSCAAMAARDGGTDREILIMGLHDIPHRIGAHRADFMLGGDSHDADIPGYLVRSGFVDHLMNLGLCNKAGVLANGVAVADLENKPDDPAGPVNWLTNSGYLDWDRRQYNLWEQATWVYDPATARDLNSHIYRDRNSPLGDQLIFDDLDAAITFTEGQIRAYTEHWSEPVAMAIDELFIVLTRWALSTSDRTAAPALKAYRQYYPGDALRILEEDWQADMLALAEAHAGVRGMLKIIDGFAATARSTYALLDGKDNPYTQPRTPTWATVFPATATRAEQHTVLSGRQSVVLIMRASKERVVNVPVMHNGKLRRIYDAVPSLVEYKSAQARRAGVGQSFDVVVDLSRVGLSPPELKGVRAIVGLGQEEWRKAMHRPHMTQAELTAHTQQVAARYRQLGALPPEVVNPAV